MFYCLKWLVYQHFSAHYSHLNPSIYRALKRIPLEQCLLVFLAFVHEDSPQIQRIHINGAQKCGLQLENSHLAENFISALCQWWACYCQTSSISYWRYCSSWQLLVQQVVSRVLCFHVSVFKYIILWRLNYYCPWAKIYVWLACANKTLLITNPQLAAEVTEMHKYRMIAQVLKVQTQHDTAGIRGINNSSMVIKLVWPWETLKLVLGIAEIPLKYRAIYSKFTHNMGLWTQDKGGSRCCVKNNAKPDPMHAQERGGIDDEHHTPDRGCGMLINCCPSFSLK